MWRQRSAAEAAGVLRELAQRVRLGAYRKHPRGPKKPRLERPRGPCYRHVSTAKLLAGRKPGVPQLAERLSTLKGVARGTYPATDTECQRKSPRDG